MEITNSLLLQSHSAAIPQKCPSHSFNRLFLPWWMGSKWSGSFLEITRIHRKCKNSFLSSLMKSQIRSRITLPLLSYSCWLKKLKLNWSKLRTWLSKESLSWKAGILNSKRLRLLWMINSCRDGSFSLLPCMKDANTWSESLETYSKSLKTWKSS